MTAQGGRLFLQFALTFQIFCEGFPLRSVLFAVSLYCISINELKGIAVVEVVVAIKRNFAVHLSVAEDEVVEDTAVPQSDETADHKQSIVTQTDLNLTPHWQHP